MSADCYLLMRWFGGRRGSAIDPHYKYSWPD
jgi:hypothetical protein